MRRLLFFVAGILVGMAIQAATAQKPDRGIVGLNHVAISVRDLDQAVALQISQIRFSSCSLPAQVRRSGSVTSALS
jgi:hypothetical protein